MTAEVMESLSPAQNVVKIVLDELTEIQCCGGSTCYSCIAGCIYPVIGDVLETIAYFWVR